MLTINKMENVNVRFAFYLIDRILKNKQYWFDLVKNTYICDVNKRSFIDSLKRGENSICFRLIRYLFVYVFVDK